MFSFILFNTTNQIKNKNYWSRFKRNISRNIRKYICFSNSIQCADSLQNLSIQLQKRNSIATILTCSSKDGAGTSLKFELNPSLSQTMITQSKYPKTPAAPSTSRNHNNSNHNNSNHNNSNHNNSNYNSSNHNNNGFTLTYDNHISYEIPNKPKKKWIKDELDETHHGCIVDVPDSPLNLSLMDPKQGELLRQLSSQKNTMDCRRSSFVRNSNNINNHHNFYMNPTFDSYSGSLKLSSPKKISSVNDISNMMTTMTTPLHRVSTFDISCDSSCHSKSSLEGFGPKRVLSMLQVSENDMSSSHSQHTSNNNIFGIDKSYHFNNNIKPVTNLTDNNNNKTNHDMDVQGSTTHSARRGASRRFNQKMGSVHTSADDMMTLS